jgi:hypothetical protein
VLKPWEETTPGKVKEYSHEHKPDAPTPSNVGTV